VAGDKSREKVKAQRAKDGSGPPRVPARIYEKELFRLQAELVKVQEWVRAEGQRLAVVFEGRDAAGKGSTIKRVSAFLNPRVAACTD
jgi:polyphosphate kinase 2 (PPK2 family)